MPNLVTRPAAVHTVSMKARLVATGLGPGAIPPDPDAAGGPEPASARVAAARSRARERGDAQRQALRPLGLVFIAVVVTASAQTHPAPGLHGTGLAVTLLLAAYGAAVLTAISVNWARRGPAAQVAAAILIGGCGIALAVVQQHGPVEIAPSMGVWIAAVRLAPVLATATAGAITAGLALAVGLTAHPAAQSAVTATLVCLLLAVTGQFIRRGRQSQDRTELLMAQLQGARKLAGREAVSAALRGTIERSADLAKAGLADARQAVGALRGEQLPTLDQLRALVEDFRRDTGFDATLRIDGTCRPLPAEASLALFRGAQEALTNIIRYAPGATTAVTVSYQPDRTVLTIEDHLPETSTTPGRQSRADLLADVGGGHGLTAMRERVQRAGGTARAGPTADGWLVELEVPA